MSNDIQCNRIKRQDSSLEVGIECRKHYPRYDLPENFSFISSYILLVNI